MDAQTAKEKSRVTPDGSGICSIGNVCVIPGWIKWHYTFQSNSEVGDLLQSRDEGTGLTPFECGQSSQLARRFEQSNTSFKKPNKNPS
jgi:hypothetical protein